MDDEEILDDVATIDSEDRFFATYNDGKIEFEIDDYFTGISIMTDDDSEWEDLYGDYEIEESIDGE